MAKVPTQEEFGEEVMRRMTGPTPADVFRVAKNNPAVATIVDAWQRGVVPTWEQALIRSVVALGEENERLRPPRATTPAYEGASPAGGE